MTRYLIAAAAALMPVPAAATGVTITADQVMTARIGYRDLDLSSQPGRNALVGRIRLAANRVCEPEAFSFAYRSNRKCYRTAVASGIAQMDAILPASGKR